MTDHVVTVTINPTIDKSCKVDHVVPEHKLRCSEPRRCPGGGGINVARVLHRFGLDVVAHWSSGGPLGDMLRGLLEEEAVPQAPLLVAGMTRENLIVTETSTGQQFRFGMPGAPLTGDELQTWCERLEKLDPMPRYLVMSGSLPPGVPDDLYARLIRAVAADTRVILDTSGEPLRRALEAHPFLIKPNFRELEQIVGRRLENDEDILRGARELIQEHATGAVVLSLGQGGALLVTEDRVERVRAPSVRIQSKVGAGDSMVGGLVSRLAAGDDLPRAVRFGVAAGAAAVMTDATELCRPEDVEKLFACMQKEG